MNNKIDVYLSRISQVSQLLLVCFAIFGYFYTVRPVYQNASLQESIAKKESELKNIQGKIDDIYSNLRSELIRKFLIRVTYECSPAMPLLMSPPEERLSSSGSYQSELNKLNSLLANNPYDCLRSKAETDSALRDLKEKDKEILIVSIESLKPIFIEKFNAALAHSKDESYLIKLGKKSNQYIEGVDKILTDSGVKLPKDDASYKESYILLGLNILIMKFGEEFSSVVFDKVTL